MPFIGDQIDHGLRAIGRDIRAARHARWWTQQALENASGVDQSVISRLENGQLTSLRLIRLAAIVAALEGHGPGRDGMAPSRTLLAEPRLPPPLSPPATPARRSMQVDE
jgi:transcriptional regulator with XRE-family HTH domain